MTVVEDSKTPSRASSHEPQSVPQVSEVDKVCCWSTGSYSTTTNFFFYLSVKVSEEADGQASNEGTDSSTKPSSSIHRPLTRSQTGTVSKRRRRDDSDHFDAALPKKRVPASQKRQKVSSSAAESTSPEVEDSDSSPKPPATRETTRETSLTASTSSSVVPISGNQLTFLHTSVPGDGNTETRFPRSRASLPTPIPNLTKKSRGRRVPTQVSTTDPDQKATRLYVCTVDGCNKCFHRGEHLKRHIRSIHTHEKRMYSFPEVIAASLTLFSSLQMYILVVSKVF